MGGNFTSLEGWVTHVEDRHYQEAHQVQQGYSDGKQTYATYRTEYVWRYVWRFHLRLPDNRTSWVEITNVGCPIQVGQYLVALFHDGVLITMSTRNPDLTYLRASGSDVHHAGCFEHIAVIVAGFAMGGTMLGAYTNHYGQGRASDGTMLKGLAGVMFAFWLSWMLARAKWAKETDKGIQTELRRLQLPIPQRVWLGAETTSKGFFKDIFSVGIALLGAALALFGVAVVASGFMTDPDTGVKPQPADLLWRVPLGAVALGAAIVLLSQDVRRRLLNALKARRS